MKIKPHQFQQIANGIRRIKNCIENCKLPVSETGTFFSHGNKNSIGYVFNNIELGFYKDDEKDIHAKDIFSKNLQSYSIVNGNYKKNALWSSIYQVTR